jgi:hypothetical protein
MKKLDDQKSKFKNGKSSMKSELNRADKVLTIINPLKIKKKYKENSCE